MKNLQKNNFSRKNRKQNHNNSNYSFDSKNTNLSKKNNRYPLNSSKNQGVNNRDRKQVNSSYLKGTNSISKSNIKVSTKSQNIYHESINKKNFDDWIWGKHSVFEALTSERAINRIWCTSEIFSSEKFYILLKIGRAHV